MSQKIEDKCIDCGNDIKVYPQYYSKSRCYGCHAIELAKKQGVIGTGNIIKEAQKTTKIKAEIKTDGAILGSLNANSSAFRRVGGFSLMKVEHVENGDDALKVLGNTLKVDSTTKLGYVRIIYDNKTERIFVIDNGSGIEDPIWIIKFPLRSRKGIFDLEVDQVGKRGRGLHGFRSFFKNLTYYTSLHKAVDPKLSTESIAHLNNIGWTKEDLKCCKLELIHNSIETDLTKIPISEFQKFTTASHGTVAVFSNPIEITWEELKKRKGELTKRIQHHYRHELETGRIEITVEDGKKIEKLEPRKFSNENGEFDLYKFPDEAGIVNNVRTVYDKNGDKLGTIEYELYKVTGEFKNNYKKPYLTTKDHRPLGDSFITEFPEMSDDNGVWKSPYVTGIVKCDFVEPDDLRIALSVEGDNAEKNKIFWQYLKADTIPLKKLIREFSELFMGKERTEENKNIMLELQSFISKQKDLDLDLPDLTELGILKDGEKGSLKKGERISDKPGGKNKGRIDPSGSDEIVITYEKQTIGPKTQKGTKREKVKKRRLKTKVPSKDGRSTTTMLIDPKLLSKDGRRRKENPKGVNLLTPEEDLNPDMSWYDPNTMSININLEDNGGNYQALEKQKKASSTEKSQVYSTKEKNYIRRYYLWELIDTFYKGAKDKMDVFWDLYEKFFRYKDTP